MQCSLRILQGLQVGIILLQQRIRRIDRLLQRDAGGVVRNSPQAVVQQGLRIVDCGLQRVSCVGFVGFCLGIATVGHGLGGVGDLAGAVGKLLCQRLVRLRIVLQIHGGQ